MKDTPLQLTLREMHRDFSKPVLWVSLIGAGVVLAFAGAFGTGDVMRPVPLGLYWITLAIITYAAGAFVAGWMRHRFTFDTIAKKLLAIGLATAAVITLIILVCNIALFGAYLLTPAALMKFSAPTFVTVFIISCLINYGFSQLPGTPAKPESPALLRRLPLEKRGALVSISAVDHYVEVSTTKGTEMILLRLSDAIAETEPTDGLQIHRSHWVALDKVASVARSAGKASVELSDGRCLPVSRANISVIKEAGLV